MAMLEIQVGMKYTASVTSAVRDLVVKPKMMKLPDKPELSKLIADKEILSIVTAVPDNLMDVYKKEMKMYAREKKRFELDSQCVYLSMKEQCSPKMISELKGFDIFDTIEEEFHLVNLLKLIKKIFYNNEVSGNTLFNVSVVVDTIL